MFAVHAQLYFPKTAAAAYTAISSPQATATTLTLYVIA